MNKAENNFLEVLEKKAKEQKSLAATQIMPKWALGLGEWLVVNPWRVLIPIAIFIYIVLRELLGSRFRELILAIFGGF